MDFQSYMGEINLKKPECVGIIMDGNRRWAKAHGLPSFEGHRLGYEKLKEVVRWCKKHGIKDLVVFAFSTENWNRAKEEVHYLLELFSAVIDDQVKLCVEEGVKLLFPGDIKRFPEAIRKKIHDAEEKTKHFHERTFAVALSYGGRAEIIDAIRGLSHEDCAAMTEEKFSQHIWTKGIPDPDMVIRTSGERRLSGFLTWKTVYSELFFTDTYWPAFSEEEFDQMIKEYGERERRYGK